MLQNEYCLAKVGLDTIERRTSFSKFGSPCYTSLESRTYLGLGLALLPLYKGGHGGLAGLQAYSIGNATRAGRMTAPGGKGRHVWVKSSAREIGRKVSPVSTPIDENIG